MDLLYGSASASCPDKKRKVPLEDLDLGDLDSNEVDLFPDFSPPGSSKSLEDFMLEDLTAGEFGDGRHNGDCVGALFGEEGFEEFGMRFDGKGANDAFDIFLDKVFEDSPLARDSSSGKPTTPNNNNNNNNSVKAKGVTLVKTANTTNGNNPNHHLHNNGKPKAVSVTINGKTVRKVVVTSANGFSKINNGGSTTTTKLVNTTTSSNNNNTKSIPAVNSFYVTWNGLNILNKSASASADLSKGISFEDSCGIMVDPSSIVPASVSGSAGSSSIGSEETDQEFLATDDESESEVINGSIAAWVVPDQAGSRSPTPESELEEAAFTILHHHTEGSHSQEPPAKKRKQKHEPQLIADISGKIYPKPGFSYSCLIAMSLKNSKTGCLPVSEIYKFMCDHFPYFKTAPSGWKNSVRHNLSLNKCFEKIEKPGNGARKGCLWALNPAKIHKMDEEVQKWSRKDPMSIKRAMSDPENLELLERGELKRDYSGNGSDEDDEDDDADSLSTPIISTPAQKLHIRKEEPVDFGTITNVQGNYLPTVTATGPQTYTLQFSNIAPTTTPIIIRRTSTPVK